MIVYYGLAHPQKEKVEPSKKGIDFISSFKKNEIVLKLLSRV